MGLKKSFKLLFFFGKEKKYYEKQLFFIEQNVSPKNQEGPRRSQSIAKVLEDQVLVISNDVFFF